MLAAFERFAETIERAEDIRLILNAEGFRTLSGKPVAKQTFHRMMVAPIYAGRIVVPRLCVDVPAAFPAIVPQATFDRVQAKLVGRGSWRCAMTRPEFPLRRFAFCAHCQRPLTGSLSRSQTGRRYAYYHCPDCCQKPVPTERLHESFGRRLSNLSISDHAMPLVRMAALDAMRTETAQARSQLTMLRRRHDAVEGKTERLRDAYIYRAAIDKNTFEAEASRLSDERRGIERAIGQLSGPRIENPEATVLSGLEILSDLLGSWNSAETQARRRFQRLIYPEGVPVLDGVVGTPVTHCAFNSLRAVSGVQSYKVALTFATSNTTSLWLRCCGNSGGWLREAEFSRIRGRGEGVSGDVH